MILLIEPDAIWQRSLERILGAIDDVEIASNGQEALKISSQVASLIVMELQLPDLHWRDLQLEMKIQNQISSIFAVTNIGDLGIVSGLLNNGFNGYFHKPTLNFSEFQKSVLNILP